MFCQRNGSVSKSRLNVASICFLRLTAGFLLLTHYCAGQSHMVGPSKPVLAMIGDDVILPCHLTPPADVVTKTLEWARFDLNPRFVHVRRDGVELLIQQNPSYVGRTSVSTDKLKCGDISLKLSKVKLSDAGRYRCHIPALGTSEFNLTVGAVSSPVVIIAKPDKTSSSVVLQCSSSGWYPEPEVLWLDGEGNLLSAGPTETVRGPDDLYTVSSRVIVEKRHSNSFTCRVQQQNISQTRDTHIRILDDVFTAPSCSAIRIGVVISVCFLLPCISAGFFLIWKRIQNKGQNQSSETGETEHLVKGSKEIKDLDEGMLQEKEEELKDVDYMISVLKEQKEELETSREKHRSELQEVEEEWSEKEKELKSLKLKFKWDKDHKQKNLETHKQVLEEKKTQYETSLQIIEESLQKTEKMMTIMTERKRKVENQIEQMKKQLERKKREREEEEREQQEREEQTNKHSELSTVSENQSSQPESSSQTEDIMKKS